MHSAATTTDSNDGHSPDPSPLSDAPSLAPQIPHVSVLERPNVSIYHVKHAIQSTQDEARRILREHSDTIRSSVQSESPSPTVSPVRPFAVVADIQLAGRGTNGRRWERGDFIDTTSDGNVYLTVALPMSSIPVTLTLLPLHVATVVAQHVSNLLVWSRSVSDNLPMCSKLEELSDQCGTATPFSKSSKSSFSDTIDPRVIVKWPNDVLVNNTKVSGTLIESETVSSDSWLLVGIGINVLSAPRSFTADTNHHGRAAGCLQDFAHHMNLPNTTALQLSIDLAQSLAEWTVTENHTLSKWDLDQVVLHQWKQWAVLGQDYQLRYDRTSNNGSGETVRTIDIEPDGQLRVRGEDGHERLLMADYLV